MIDEPQKYANIAPKPARDEKGRLLPGQSGNPNGRPKIPDEHKGPVKQMAWAVLRRLLEKAHAGKLKDELALKVAAEGLDRTQGRPAQHNINEDITPTTPEERKARIAELFGRLEGR